MPILNRAAEMQNEITGWRHQLHRIPELGFDVFRTAAFVEDKLRAFGCDEIVTGLGKTGVVGLIRGKKGDGPVIGLRCDMDALPISETAAKPYSSTIAGNMHACGHDGHMAMLLGAAKYLAETRNFAGSVAVIFQPAEEGLGGGKAMVDDGMIERCGIVKVFGMHNIPGIPVGNFAIRPGPIMAATAEFTVTVHGRGGHAAMPHTTIDPIVIATELVSLLQTIASRTTSPLDSAVLSVTKFHAGDAFNVIPETAEIAGTVRTLKQEVATITEERIRAICAGLETAFGASIDVVYKVNYPVTFNHVDETVFAGDIAESIAGAANIDRGTPPIMAGEDFSYMLNLRPGAMIFIGNGDSAGLHHPAYDFNDEAIAHGMSYWVRLSEAALAA